MESKKCFSDYFNWHSEDIRSALDRVSYLEVKKDNAVSNYKQGHHVLFMMNNGLSIHLFKGAGGSDFISVNNPRSGRVTTYDSPLNKEDAGFLDDVVEFCRNEPDRVDHLPFSRGEDGSLVFTDSYAFAILIDTVTGGLRSDPD